MKIKQLIKIEPNYQTNQINTQIHTIVKNKSNKHINTYDNQEQTILSHKLIINWMQTFKQIPYQNYIQLKFNTKNLQQAQRQQALIKYKRNAQLLAEIFSFKKQQNYLPPQPTKMEPQHITINQGTLFIYCQAILNKHKDQITTEQQKSQQQLQTIKQSATFYQQTLKSINQTKSKQQLLQQITQIRQKGLQDHRHPFFCQSSPFYMYSGDQEVLQVKEIQAETNDQDDQGLNLLEFI